MLFATTVPGSLARRRLTFGFAGKVPPRSNGGEYGNPRKQGRRHGTQDGIQGDGLTEYLKAEDGKPGHGRNKQGQTAQRTRGGESEDQLFIV
jgi:hypothetical protein